MSFISRAIDTVRILGGQVVYGKVVILLGTRRTGKSETVKSLCESIAGPKFIIHPNENLIPQPLHNDEREEYRRIPGCSIVENELEVNWQPGLYVLEDFPFLTDAARRELYNEIRDARHHGINFLIVAHDYNVLRHTVFNHANAILLYRGAVIVPQQLRPRINSLAGGFAIERALNDLPEYHYRLISFEHRRWDNNPINSREVRKLSRIIRGLLTEAELSEITYPRHAILINRRERDCKQDIIEVLIQEGLIADEISSAVDTTPENVWKVKCNMKKRYIANNGEHELPDYLRDSRRRRIPN